jgi:hypothetical protein
VDKKWRQTPHQINRNLRGRRDDLIMSTEIPGEKRLNELPRSKLRGINRQRLKNN